MAPIEQRHLALFSVKQLELPLITRSNTGYSVFVRCSTMEYSHKSMTGSLVHDTSNTVRDSGYSSSKISIRLYA